jgi:DHA2 family multidrug resistance protein
MDTASPAAAGAAEIPAHAGASLILAGLVLAAANFLVVLDTTIANVSVPNIAGGLAVSSSDGTWVITSYAVAEAITVPLTGWLAARFGSVKVFVAGMAGFGLFSFLCGLAPSLGALVAFRVLQGLCGGPLIPLSQTLLLRVFPARHAAAATGLWAMTTLTAPIAGPILGGVLCDNIGWSSIFWINVPIAGVCAWAAWSLLRRCETPTRKARIDAVGLALLIVWVAALQTMLDLGKDRDWFQSATIVALGLTALIGFAAFVIWELTEANPIVDLRVFRHRGYSAAVFTLCIGFGAFFGTVVLTPLWLQQNLGYTATWAGLATAPLGVAAVMAAPVAAALSTKVDVRRLVCLGLAWMAFITLIRSQADSQMGFWEISRWLFAQGFGMPLFFVPLTGLALASVAVEETASAAGLMSFCRTFSGAIATSLVTTVWENGASRDHDDLSGLLRGAGAQVDRLVRHGFGPHQAAGIVDQLVQSQSVMLATNQVFMTLAILFLLACLAVWLAPRPTRLAAGVAAH